MVASDKDDRGRLDSVSLGPSAIRYIPDFIDADYADFLLRRVYACPGPKWTTLRNRRLQLWGCQYLQNAKPTGNSLVHDGSREPEVKPMIQEPLPEWLASLGSRISDFAVKQNPNDFFNQVLINEYLPGQGILPHTDGPAFEPFICTVNLGGPVLLDFRDNRVPIPDEPAYSVYMRPLSLVVVADTAYTNHLHSIAERRVDTLSREKIVNWDAAGLTEECDTGKVVKERTETRVSLTFRRAKKVIPKKRLFRL